MPEEPFEDSTTYYAYSCIHHFFDDFEVGHALKYAESILRAATRSKVWEKEVPANLLFYMEKFKALCAAAFTIHYSHARRKEAIIAEPDNNVPDMSVTKHFMDNYYFSSAWNNFPRHLTGRQYYNPYRAIKKFCAYMAEQEWNTLLKEITEYALSKGRMDETYPSYHILPIRLRMLQLIEACRLLDVRANRKQTEPKPAPNQYKKKHHKKIST